ncbi:hypothetical protein K438DRAFT_1946231 [Mycena galopus ATCC 62051]|nr:hypothetical protein K438DRAFT_1946231 [Mycena galopus ATCC 62051]
MLSDTLCGGGYAKQSISLDIDAPPHQKPFKAREWIVNFGVRSQNLKNYIPRGLPPHSEPRQDALVGACAPSHAFPPSSARRGWEGSVERGKGLGEGEGSRARTGERAQRQRQSALRAWRPEPRHTRGYNDGAASHDQRTKARGCDPRWGEGSGRGGVGVGVRVGPAAARMYTPCNSKTQDGDPSFSLSFSLVLSIAEGGRVVQLSVGSWVREAGACANVDTNESGGSRLGLHASHDGGCVRVQVRPATRIPAGARACVRACGSWWERGDAGCGRELGLGRGGRGEGAIRSGSGKAGVDGLWRARRPFFISPQRQLAARCGGGGKVKEGRGRGETGAAWVGAAAREGMECVQATGVWCVDQTRNRIRIHSIERVPGSHPTFLVPAAVLMQKSQEGIRRASARAEGVGVGVDARPGAVYRGFVREDGGDTMPRVRGTNAEILVASKRRSSVSTQTVQLVRASAVVVGAAAAAARMAAVVRAVCRRAQWWLLRRGDADAVRGQVAVVVCEGGGGGEGEGASGRGVETRYVMCGRRRLTRARHESALFSILLRIRVGGSKKEEEWGWGGESRASAWDSDVRRCVIWGQGGECTLAGFPKKAIGIWRVSRRLLSKSHSISPSEFPYPSAASLVDPGLVPEGEFTGCAPLCKWLVHCFRWCLGNGLECWHASKKELLGI